MTKNCLLIIDMQNDFLARLDADTRGDLIASTNQLISVFRVAACPVIWIRQVFRPDLSDAYLEMKDRGIAVVIDGTPGAEIAAELAVARDDHVITKKRYSAFFGTDLDQTLEDLAPNQITLAGVNTHACVRTTAIDAYQRDLRVILASECIDSYDHEHARISLAYMDEKIGSAMTNAQIRSALK